MPTIPFTIALVTAPTADVVTYDQAKAQCALEHDLHRTMLELMRDAAVAELDPAAGGWLGRALRPQTWELRLAAFPCGEIRLPHPPLIAITSLKYDDGDGVERTLVENTDFVVVGRGGKRCQSVVPAYGLSWPAARCQPESVRIRYSCGHPPAAAAQGETPAVLETLPAAIRQWLLLEIGTLYANRESTVVGNTTPVRLPHVDASLDKFRPYWTPPQLP